MSFWLGRDFFNNPIVPPYVLCKSNKERIGSINCINKNITLKYNALDEIQFNTYLYMDGEKNKYYDDISIMKGILLPKIGFYIITSVDVTSEGESFEYKSVTAKSSECLIGQKYLELFSINMGLTESINSVRFYDIGDKEHSLLHLVLDKTNWEIGHVDVGLETMQRSFQIDRQDIYSFLTVDVAEAFECIFVFDTLNNKINVYKEDNYSKDTNVYVSFNNLLKSASVNYSDANIKTCLTLIGADDLNIREINLGFEQIFNLNYYHSTEFMSKSLYGAWDLWVKKRSGYLDTYTSLLSEYQKYIIQINDLTHNKMPDDLESTDWTLYGLVPLEEKLAIHEQKQSVMMKTGWGNKEHQNYESHYLPVYNTIEAIKAQIDIVDKELTKLKKEQNVYYSQMSDIITDLAMENNFTQEQLKELSNFIREDELTSDNYVVTKTMTDEEKFEMLDSFLKHGEKELAKKSTPQLSFTADMLNLFSMEEFVSWYNDFNVGNYIHVSLRDGYLVKPKLLTISFDFLDLTDFSVEFGNVVKNGNKLHDITEAIAIAEGAATSVSFNSSHWNEACKETDDIGKMLEAGLLGAGQYLKSGDDSEMIIDSRGIFVNTTSGEYANKDSIFIGGGRILFTDDNWKTVAMAVGRADVNGESRFGVFADFVIAGYIAASTIEGSKIVGGTVESANYQKGKYGTFLNLNDGTFEFNGGGEKKLYFDGTTLTAKGTIQAEKGWFGGTNGFIVEAGKLYNTKTGLTNASEGVYIGTDGIALGKNSVFVVNKDGSLTATSATIKGTIKADKGYIGGETNGFTIESGKLYSGSKNSLNADVDGVYVGNDGIALGKNGVFKVTKAGAITAISGSIGGATIRSDSIRASNGNWWIGSDGSAHFKHVTLSDNVSINGVQGGSSFGSIGYDGSTTWGNFGGGSYFGSTVGSPFGGTCVTHIESISAKYIKTNYLDAMEADIGNLKTETANIRTLIADEISAAKIYAETVSTNTLNAAKIYADNITAKFVDAEYVNSAISTAFTSKFDILECTGTFYFQGNRIYIGADGVLYATSRSVPVSE
mgnify:CR=1 FL=1